MNSPGNPGEFCYTLVMRPIILFVAALLTTIGCTATAGTPPAPPTATQAPTTPARSQAGCRPADGQAAAALLRTQMQTADALLVAGATDRNLAGMEQARIAVQFAALPVCAGGAQAAVLRVIQADELAFPRLSYGVPYNADLLDQLRILANAQLDALTH